MSSSVLHSGCKESPNARHHQEIMSNVMDDEHHYMRHEPVKKGTSSDDKAGRGGHGEVHHHKDLASYVNHHAKNDAQEYKDRHHYYEESVKYLHKRRQATTKNIAKTEDTMSLGQKFGISDKLLETIKGVVSDDDMVKKNDPFINRLNEKLSSKEKMKRGLYNSANEENHVLPYRGTYVVGMRTNIQVCATYSVS